MDGPTKTKSVLIFSPFFTNTFDDFKELDPNGGFLGQRTAWWIPSVHHHCFKTKSSFLVQGTHIEVY